MTRTRPRFEIGALALAFALGAGCAKEAKTEPATPAPSPTATPAPATPVATPAPATPAPATGLLAVGDTAPEFEAQAHDGKTVSLSSLAGKPVVLYFYPKDDTPG